MVWLPPECTPVSAPGPSLHGPSITHVYLPHLLVGVLLGFILFYFCPLLWASNDLPHAEILSVETWEYKASISKRLTETTSGTLNRGPEHQTKPLLLPILSRTLRLRVMDILRNIVDIHPPPSHKSLSCGQTPIRRRSLGMQEQLLRAFAQSPAKKLKFKVYVDFLP